MAQFIKAKARPAPKDRRRLIGAVTTLAIAVGVLITLTFVPYYSVSKVIQVSSGTSATTTLTIPRAAWVTVHFDHPSEMGMSMNYWMHGSNGMRFDDSMMGGSDSYSFWSWSGTYQCGASYTGSESGSMPVWVNATWGVL
jgi:hypothetical protein